MTSKQLESLNRRTRILRRVRAGDPYHEIARDEGVMANWVSVLACEAGIRVSREEFGRRISEGYWRSRGSAEEKITV